MRIYEIISWVGLGCVVAGSLCLAIMQQRHAFRFGGYYRSLTKKPVHGDIKLLKISAVFFSVGIFLLIIGACAK